MGGTGPRSGKTRCFSGCVWCEATTCRSTHRTSWEGLHWITCYEVVGWAPLLRIVPSRCVVATQRRNMGRMLRWEGTSSPTTQLGTIRASSNQPKQLALFAVGSHPNTASHSYNVRCQLDVQSNTSWQYRYLSHPSQIQHPNYVTAQIWGATFSWKMSWLHVAVGARLSRV